MLKKITLLLLVVGLAPCVWGQTTSVSGTITDSSSVVWKNGTYSFTFLPSPTNPTANYLQNGLPFNKNTTISGALDATGSLTSIAVPDNLTITPSGSQWTFQVCPAATATNGCFNVNLTITGASQTITSAVVPPPVTVSLVNPGFYAAYTDGEISGAKQGSTYFNLSDATLHICNLPICTWLSLASPTSILGLNNTFTGNNAFSGTNTFTGAINCTVVNAVRCVSLSNPQGWAGSDVGAWVNSAISNCAGPCEIQIAAGTYNYSTTIQYANGVTLRGAGPETTLLSYTGSGVAVSMTNVTGAVFDNMQIVINNVTAVGLKIWAQKSFVNRFHLSGISAAKCIWITGDGVSATSAATTITSGFIACGTAIGLIVDHAIDTFISDVSNYGNQNNTTSQELIIDRGVSGFYLKSMATGAGLHGLVVQNTSSGGAYGSPPVFLFFDQFLADTSTGGDAILFDSSLSTNLVSAHFTNSWAAGAGLNSSSSVVTAGSQGIHISGGQNIEFIGGRIRHNSGNGVLIDNANVANVRIREGMINDNNFDNTATQHGINVTAAATDLSFEGSRIGNGLEATSGFQRYGINLAAVHIDHVEIIGNNLAGNVTNALNNLSTGTFNVLANGPPSALTTQTIWGALTIGSGSGTGPLIFQEGLAPTAIAGDDICYGDSTAHLLKCSYNNGSFFPSTQTIGSGTTTTNGTAIATLTSQAQPSITVNGATVTDVAQCSLNAATPASWQTGIVMLPPVVTANAVTVWLSNPTATANITPAATVVRCTVTR